MKRILARLEKRKEYLDAAIDKLRRQILSGVIGDDTEDLRLWLEQFCIGRGLDICVGDFTIGDSIGIDGDTRKLGAHYNLSGGELTPFDSGELDYIVTNYFDCFPNPLHVLQEWHRVLKKDGTLAFAVCDVAAYPNPKGPLANNHRLSAFTSDTIRCYLERAEFKVREIRNNHKHLLIHAVRQ